MLKLKAHSSTGRFLKNFIKIITRSHTQRRRFPDVDTLVVVSKSACVYENLSIEDWLYENVDLSPGNRLLFIYQNAPCVVIGKFQNQWVEADIGYMTANSIRLARRKSGGGSVYHDLGNINLSFFTHRQDYNRPYNLNIVTNCLNHIYPHLSLERNARDDIVLDGVYKVSGSAAKLTTRKAYHHCTLLVDSDRRHLSSSLLSPFKNNIETTASRSIASPVANLNTTSHPVQPQRVVQLIAEAFIEKQYSITIPKGRVFMQYVSFDDDMMPGVKDICSDLRSWQWIYGKTPDFTLQYPEPNSVGGATISMRVVKGLITDIQYVSPLRGSINLTETYARLPFCPLTLSDHLERQPGTDELPLLESLIQKLRLNVT